MGAGSRVLGGAAHAVAETLRLESGPRGVRVTMLSPGFVATDLVAGDAATDDDTAAFAERMHDQGLEPADVAAAVVHLLGLPPHVAVVEDAVHSVRQRGYRRPVHPVDVTPQTVGGGPRRERDQNEPS